MSEGRVVGLLGAAASIVTIATFLGVKGCNQDGGTAPAADRSTFAANTVDSGTPTSSEPPTPDTSDPPSSDSSDTATPDSSDSTTPDSTDSSTPDDGGDPATGRVAVKPGWVLRVYAAPRLSSTVVTTLPNGTVVTIYCTRQGDVARANGVTSSLWDRVDDGFVPDVDVYTGTNDAVAPPCD